MPNITISLPDDLYLELKKQKNKSAIVAATLKKYLYPLMTRKDYDSPEYRKLHKIKEPNLKRDSIDTFHHELPRQEKAQSERITKLMQEEEHERIKREDVRAVLETEVKREIRAALMAELATLKRFT